MTRAPLEAPQPQVELQEQGTIPTSSAPPGFMRRHLGEAGMRLSLAYVCLASTIGATALIPDNDAPVSRMVPDGSPVIRTINGANPYHSVNLQANTDNAAVINAEIDHTYASTGHEIDIVGADANAQAAYAHDIGEEKSTSPAGIEIIRIQDRQLFAPELNTAPNVYPFIAYNGTGEHIDIQYLDYAMEAVRGWLDATERHGGEVTFGDRTRYHVEARSVPHALIFSDKMPGFMTAAVHAGTDGATHWDTDSTRSFILPSGKDRKPFRPVAIGTEVCQFMVEVSGAHALPGKAAEQLAMQRYISQVNPDNPPALHDANLADQEATCNTLGRGVAAYYQDGEAGLQEIEATLGRRNTAALHALSIRSPLFPHAVEQEGQPIWIDPGIYASFVPELARIKTDTLAYGHTQVITAKGASSPTARYYAHHQPDGPPVPAP